MKSFMNRRRTPAVAAVALAALAAQANAQSNVTFYGNLDIAISKTNGASATMGPGYFNWLGVAGKEQLGDGLDGIFNLQMRFNPDTGTLSNPGTFWQGESTVGLQSASLGRLRLGRAMSAAWQSLWRLEPWGNGATFATLSAYQTGSYSSDGMTDAQMNYATWARINNAVFYDTPSWAGLNMTLASEVELAAGARRRNRGVAFNYDSGPVLAVLSYEKNHNNDSFAYIGGSYVLGGLKLFANYAHTRVMHLNSEKLYMLAATYAINGRDSIRAGYGSNRGLDSHKTSLGYVHGLSKRTNVYADVWSERFQGNAHGVALGLNHMF